jgi:hypothetical protein
MAQEVLILPSYEALMISGPSTTRCVMVRAPAISASPSAFHLERYRHGTTSPRFSPVKNSRLILEKKIFKAWVAQYGAQRCVQKRAAKDLHVSCRIPLTSFVAQGRQSISQAIVLLYCFAEEKINEL